MRDLKDSFRRSGYNPEEAYFAKLNRELIQRIKAKLRLFRGGKSEALSSQDNSPQNMPVQYKKAA